MEIELSQIMLFQKRAANLLNFSSLKITFNQKKDIFVSDKKKVCFSTSAVYENFARKYRIRFFERYFMFNLFWHLARILYQLYSHLHGINILILLRTMVTSGG